tara:strand:- start:59 stop:664 length:606 start_codon:yes stop_codon:yes gene_type:complete
MKLKYKISIIFLSFLFLTGCISTNSYVDPSFSKSNYNDIKLVNERYKIMVFTEFQRNGRTLALPVLQTNVERILRSSGIIIPSKESAHSITVIVNNIADIGEAAAKGFGTGFTFGLVGTTVTDYYELKISYTDSKGSTTLRNYRHAIHTTVGNAAGPAGVIADTPDNAFSKVIEEILLNFIIDMQKLDKLSMIPLKKDKVS